MPKLPGVNHLAAVRALEKIGFVVIRQGKHITLSDGLRTVQNTARKSGKCLHDGHIAKQCGLSPDEFRQLL
jgi:predicted RNA binding protein YcfA (HicA-like mRNA interferase family)